MTQIHENKEVGARDLAEDVKEMACDIQISCSSMGYFVQEVENMVDHFDDKFFNEKLAAMTTALKALVSKSENLATEIETSMYEIQRHFPDGPILKAA